MKQWDSMAATLLNRDGDNPKFPNGGHRIKSDPLLIRAIEEIRDGYFMLFKEKGQLLKDQKANPDDAGIATAIADIDYDLILYNNAALSRLKSPNYGCIPKAGEEEKPGLEHRDAYLITGTIIKRSINSFEVAFARDKFDRPHVPHVPLTKGPEATGRTRTAPAPDWVSGLTQSANAEGRSL
jgi:hypothetical protein